MYKENWSYKWAWWTVCHVVLNTTAPDIISRSRVISHNFKNTNFPGRTNTWGYKSRNTKPCQLNSNRTLDKVKRLYFTLVFTDYTCYTHEYQCTILRRTYHVILQVNGIYSEYYSILEPLKRGSYYRILNDNDNFLQAIYRASVFARTSRSNSTTYYQWQKLHITSCYN